jgi:hypothetical protein
MAAATSSSGSNKVQTVPAGVTLLDLVSGNANGQGSDTASVGSSTSRLGSADTKVNKKSGRSVSFDEQQTASQPIGQAVTQTAMKSPVTAPAVAPMLPAPVVAPVPPASVPTSAAAAVPAAAAPVVNTPMAAPVTPAAATSVPTPAPLSTQTSGLEQTPAAALAPVIPTAPSDRPLTPSEMLAAERNKMGSRSGSRGGSRPTTADGLLLSEYNQLKKDLKKWKAEFVAANGREPTVADFNDLDHALKVKIARKNQLKKILGDAANNTSGMSSRKSKRPQTGSSTLTGTDPINEEF